MSGKGLKPGREAVLRVPLSGGEQAAPIRHSRRRLWGLLLPPLVLLVPVLALIVAGRFDGLYGQDPYAYYDYAIGPARESLLALRPLPPFFWPPGYPLLVALASLLIGPTPAAGQVVSLLMGAATVVFTALLAEEVWVRHSAQAGASGWLVPLAAALLVACLPQLWQSSTVVMADTTGLAAATFGAWALARYARQRRGPWLALAAGGLAFALLSRWIYGLVAVPAAVYALGVLGRTTNDERRRTNEDRRWTMDDGRRKGVSTHIQRGGRPWLHAAVALAVVLIVLSPLLVPLVRESTAAPTAEAVPFAGSFGVYTWHPLNALRREFTTTDGLLNYRLLNGLYYALTPAHRYYFTPLLAGLLLPGLCVALGRGRHTLWWLVAWAGLVYAFHAGAPWQNFRFTLAYLTPLAVLAAIGLEALLGWLGPRWRRPALAVFGLGLVAMLAGGVALTQGFVARKQADLRTVEQVEARLPPDAVLLTFNMTFTFQHYSTLETHELYYLAAAELPALLADGRPAYLLIDAHNVETQWGQEPLGAAYHWLRDKRGLDTIEHFGSLTLSRIDD